MTDFENWRSFDFDNAVIQLWVFKKSTTNAKYRAWYVNTDAAAETFFRNSIKSEAERIIETINYSPIAQNHENSCLLKEINEGLGVSVLIEKTNVPEGEHLATLKDLKGAIGYLVKFQVGNELVYAVRKTPPVWKSKVRKSLANFMFKDGELSIVPDESFTFDAYFDFYCFNTSVFIVSKRSYESTASDKEAYQKGFDDLTIAESFINMFTDLGPIKKYVGTNSIHLRRMSVIQQKAVYLIPGFIEKLRSVSDLRGWGISFDQNQKILLTDETVKTVIQVLLDHRLLSEITDKIYDVPDGEAITT